MKLSEPVYHGKRSGPVVGRKIDANDTTDVPSGMNVDKTIAWVADDPDRARRALDVERVSSSPRQTLVSQLEQKTDIVVDEARDDTTVGPVTDSGHRIDDEV